MSFIHSGSQTRINMDSMDSYAAAYIFNKKCFNIFWWWCIKYSTQYSNVFQIASTFVTNAQHWSFFLVRSLRNHLLSHLTGATLQDDLIGNFQFQRLRSYWQRISQSLQIFMDRLCTLTAGLQNQKKKIQSKIFENNLEAVDH